MDPHKPKFLEVPATVTAAHPDQLLTIDVRPSFLLHFEESYILTPRTGGTKFVHRYRCRGLFALLRFSGVRKSFETMLSSIDGILLSYLQSKYGRPKSPARRPKPKFGTGRR